MKLEGRIMFPSADVSTDRGSQIFIRNLRCSQKRFKNVATRRLEIDLKSISKMLLPWTRALQWALSMEFNLH